MGERTGRPGPQRDAGTGALGSLSGLVVVLAFLLLGTDVLLELHARSTVTAVAYDAARRVAVADGEGRPEAERRARRALGQVGASAHFTWAADGDQVTLRVEAERPGALLTALGLRSRHFDREVTVRREEVG